jgi:3-deoxy-7-phosphoheptulonate synthase
MGAWSPTSWRARPATQQPTYPDPAAVDRAVAELGRLPPLVTSWEIEALRVRLDRVSRGELFLLQGGDCAESFDDCDSSVIAAKLKILMQMSLVLVHGAKLGVVRVGRIAGQYAKPRSTDLETRDGTTLPAYRGDLVNRPGFTPEERTPDPWLLVRGYERAALTLNFIRGLADGGFADLHHPENWDLSFVKNVELAGEYGRIVGSLRDALEFMEAVSDRRISETSRVELFTSHEGLSLLYEEAQTRRVPRRSGWYNLSTHLPWIGVRTSDPEGAHVEYVRGIENPIGLKVGPGTAPERLIEILDRIDPDRVPGRIVAIHRLGADAVEAKVPPLVEAVRRVGRRIVWVSDPMHGNTETLPNGIKTRRFDKILAELAASFDVHTRLGSILGGVHFELTGENVTECLGGASGLAEADLSRAYRSRVDPRLNYEQALELAMLCARQLATHRKGASPAP